MSKGRSVTGWMALALALLALAGGIVSCSDSSTGSDGGYRLTWYNDYSTAVTIYIEGNKVRWTDLGDEKLGPGATKTTWEYYPAGTHWDATIVPDASGVGGWEFNISIDADHTSFKTVP